MVVGSQAPNAALGAGSEEPAILRLNEGYTFITTWNCPYAQRTWIVLNEKGVNYEAVHVDLQDKPEWFFKYNENGRVPTIVWQAAHEKTQGFGSVYESLVVNEYLEETHPSPPMLPQDPYGRAQARLLIDQYGQKVAPHFGKLMFAKDEDTVKAATEGLNQGLKWLEQRIHPEGPFILGPDFSLVDAAIVPFIMRLETLKVLRGYELPPPEEFPRLARWTAAAASRKSVMDTIQPPDEDRSYVDQLVDTTKKMLARMKV